jgi:hypothetical protein
MRRSCLSRTGRAAVAELPAKQVESAFHALGAWSLEQPAASQMQATAPERLTTRQPPLSALSFFMRRTISHNCDQYTLNRECNRRTNLAHRIADCAAEIRELSTRAGMNDVPQWGVKPSRPTTPNCAPRRLVGLPADYLWSTARQVMLGSTDPIASLTSSIGQAYRIAQCSAPQLVVMVTRGFAPGNSMDRSSQPL